MEEGNREEGLFAGMILKKYYALLSTQIFMPKEVILPRTIGNCRESINLWLLLEARF
jgi:hypothetical protein